MNRRLHTIVFRKKIVPTAKTARQMITHRKILVDQKVINSPSYIVPKDLEGKISLKISKKKESKKKPIEATEEIKEEEKKNE